MHHSKTLKLEIVLKQKRLKEKRLLMRILLGRFVGLKRNSLRATSPKQITIDIYTHYRHTSLDVC